MPRIKNITVKTGSPTKQGSGEPTTLHERLAKKIAQAKRPMKQVSGNAKIPALPAKERKWVIDVLVAWAGDWVQSRAEEILKEPWLYGDNLEEVREEIFDALEKFSLMYDEPLGHLIWDAYWKAGMSNIVSSKET
jgi:hypothetical protein